MRPEAFPVAFSTITSATAKAKSATAATTSCRQRPQANKPKVAAINPKTVYCSAVILQPSRHLSPDKNR